MYLYFQRIPILVHLAISFLRITTLPILIAGAALVKFQFEIPFRIKARLFKCWLSFDVEGGGGDVGKAVGKLKVDFYSARVTATLY